MTLNKNDQYKLAKSVLQKGMNITQLKNLGIDISQFSVQEQARLYSIQSAKKIDDSINKSIRDVDDELDR